MLKIKYKFYLLTIEKVDDEVFIEAININNNNKFNINSGLIYDKYYYILNK
jgi:hypothetical protein